MRARRNLLVTLAAYVAAAGLAVVLALHGGPGAAAVAALAPLQPAPAAGAAAAAGAPPWEVVRLGPSRSPRSASARTGPGAGRSAAAAPAPRSLAAAALALVTGALGGYAPTPRAMVDAAFPGLAAVPAAPPGGAAQE